MNAGKTRNGNIKCGKFQSIACSNRKKKSCVASLPEEIVFFILVRLPADILYNSAQYVLLAVFLGSPGIMFWDVWDLCDPMSGEWKKLYRIEWDFKKSRSRQVFKGLLSRSVVKTVFLPIAWVNNGEVVLFCVSCSPGPYIAYNVKTGETFTFGSHASYEWWYFWRDYAYSLVWLTPSSLITRGGGGGS
ncbi:hypothetical protein Acr_01g0003890 [Actinidia rufa]|uniref:Uncharacterized protein n=1 Tax=Actinidia rufa TaxID=165716 RepID=A0A7J0E2H4_9ERIC|nr:hypothetical protein Acr_01g0003890 [Actinidia rufa]